MKALAIKALAKIVAAFLLVEDYLTYLRGGNCYFDWEKGRGN